MLPFAKRLVKGIRQGGYPAFSPCTLDSRRNRSAKKTIDSCYQMMLFENMLIRLIIKLRIRKSHHQEGGVIW